MFTVTFNIPGKGTFTERGLTREGVKNLMLIVLRASGFGVVHD